jgi:glycosyltransferase involved in cell wall biosynthesis
MHVLYLFPHFTSHGGAASFVLNSAQRLTERGVKVTIVAQEGKEDIISSCRGVDFRFVGGPLPKSIGHWIGYPIIFDRVSKEIREADPDIIFPHVFPANYWGFLYKAMNPEAKCVWYCHEPSAFVHDPAVIDELPDNLRTMAMLVNPMMAHADRMLVKKCDRLLVNSKYTAGRVRQCYGIESELIYTGIDCSEYPVGQGSKERFFLSAGRLTKFKNVDLSLRAIAELKRSGRKGDLIVAGDGPELAPLVELSSKLDIRDRVQFIGDISRKDLISLYSRAYCVVFPSVNEPFGLISIEAQAASTPVIAFNSGGCAETVIHGETGLLVEPFDHTSLARAMTFALDNEEWMLHMGRRGRDNVRNKFSWTRTINGLMAAFTE